MAEQISYESLAPGTEFGERYFLLRVLGHGGFGKVFLADDLTLEIRVALKVLNPALAHDEKQIKRFRREVVVARKISHRNVCKLYDIGQISNIVYLTMEFIDGRDLYGMLGKHRAFPLQAGLDICYQIGSALEAAHREGVVHRDLKPHNVIIDREGVAKILDFGIARSIDLEGVTATGMMMGTPTYMSPEQARGEPGDPRSDLYSFGVLMYQLFTGAAPFTAETPLGVLFQHVQQAPRPPVQLNPELPAEINDLILKCLAKDAAQRYQHAREISEDIDRYFKSQGWTLGIPAADRETLFAEFASGHAQGDSPPKQGRSPVPKERAAPPPKLPVPRPRPQAPPEPTASTIAIDSSTPARPDTPPELRAERRPGLATPPEAPTVETPGSRSVAAQGPEQTPAASRPGQVPAAQRLEQTPAASRPEQTPAQEGPEQAHAPLRPEQTPAGRRARPAPRMTTPAASQPVFAAERRAADESPSALEPTAIVPLPAALPPFETEEPTAPSSRLLLTMLVGVSLALGIAVAVVGPRLWSQFSRPVAIPAPRPAATAAVELQVASAAAPTFAALPEPAGPAAAPEPPEIVAPPLPGSGPPTPTLVPTEPPTAMPEPPTSTPVPPTSTPVPPTSTPVPPTSTRVPPTATPEPTEPPPTKAPAQKKTPTPLPTRKPARTPTPPAPSATVPPSPTPRPAPPTPTLPPAVELVDNIILGGLPADAEICIDGSPTKGSKQGLSFILGGIEAGPHRFSFTSKQRGSAVKTVEILGGGKRNPAIKLQEGDWKAPRFRVTLQSGAEKIELERQVGGRDEVQLRSGETIVLELSLQEAKLTIRRADGREHEKFCPWQERAACGPLPLLGCGTVPVPQ